MEEKRAPSKRFEDLIVWEKSHKFVLDIYKLTSGFPKSEMFGLSSQLRRAAISIPANIVEGYKKLGRADKARFLNIAQGSLEECRYYLILAGDLGYSNTAQLQKDLEEIARVLEAYRRSVQAPLDR
jgi:four helix bundle protein